MNQAQGKKKQTETTYEKTQMSGLTDKNFKAAIQEHCFQIPQLIPTEVELKAV